MSEIINSINNLPNINKKNISIALKIIEEQQNFSELGLSEIEHTIKNVIDLINNPSTTAEGLLLLKQCVTQCSSEIIENKGTLWINLCTKICLQRNPLTCCSNAYNILGCILEKSVHIPELNKTITNVLLTKILETININMPPSIILPAFKCLEICLKLFPGSCGMFKISAEKFILTLIDSNDDQLITQTGKCLHLLQQVRIGGGGHGGICYKNAWQQFQLDIISNLHLLFNDMYANCQETFDFNINLNNAKTTGTLSNIPTMVLSEDPVTRSNQLYNRFKNLCNYLCIALLQPYPVSKLIQPEKILTLVSRGLAVNITKLLNNLTIDIIAVNNIIPLIHNCLFKLLISIILILRGNALPYTHNILDYVNQTLKWTSIGNVIKCKRSFVSLRKIAYDTLILWLQTTTSGSSVELIADKIIETILEDIVPYQKEVTLQMATGSHKNLSKKARLKLLKAQNESSNLLKKQNTETIDLGNEQLCSIALDTLINILNYNGCLLKPTLHKMLQEKIVKLSLSSIDYATVKVPYIYASNICRCKLFETLHSLIISPHHLCPPPLQYGCVVFSTAQIRDPNRKIREICFTFMKSIERTLHPQKESLHFPIDRCAMRDALIGNQEDKTNLSTSEDTTDDDEEIIEISGDDKNTCPGTNENEKVIHMETATEEENNNILSTQICENEIKTITIDEANNNENIFDFLDITEENSDNSNSSVPISISDNDSEETVHIQKRKLLLVLPLAKKQRTTSSNSISNVIINDDDNIIDTNEKEEVIKQIENDKEKEQIETNKSDIDENEKFLAMASDFTEEIILNDEN